MNRPLRSVLYMPASNARAIAKARDLPCDAVVLDLEDAVAAEDKLTARAQACAAIREGGFGRRLTVVRINALATAWGRDDLAAVVAAGPGAVLAPKVDGPLDVAALTAGMAEGQDSLQLWAMVETARAVIGVQDLAAAGGRLSALVVGPNDLAKETGMRMTPGREPFFFALSAVVTAARANGLAALDGPYGAIENLEGLEAECRQGRDFGFDGKTIIHPSHIAACNRVYAPDPEELAFARAVVGAYSLPENAGRGVLRVNGRMAERLHLAMAQKLLAIDAAIPKT